MDQASRRRANVLSVGFGVFFAFLMARLYSIQVAGYETYNQKREKQSRGTVRIEPIRGPIRDARGEYLAVSVPVASAWANPSAIQDRAAAVPALAQALGLREEFVRERLAASDREFVWLKRRITPSETDRVRRLMGMPLFQPEKKSPGQKLGLATESARRYPFGSLLSNTLGFVSMDEGKNEQLERTMDAYLRGEARSAVVTVDGRRRVLDAPAMEISGADVILTVDALFQQIVEEELDAACAEHRPRWAVAVAMDPRSGAVLSIADRPTFDPNDPGRSSGDARRNRVVTDPYEPGSTLKPFLAAWALDQGLVTPETRFDCENGLWKRGSRILHDHHPYGLLTLAQVIIYSSNIGAAKLGAEKLGRDRMYAGLRRFGFGERTGIDLSAEDSGRLLPPSRWSEYSLTSIPIGHEISATPLQLAAAMSAIANGGMLYQPFVVQRVVAPDGTILAENSPYPVRRVVTEKSARQMIEMLKGVVAAGTGKKAQVPGIQVAGKTGTTQKVDPRTRQYSHEKFISSFVGFAPAENARVCVAVVMDEPQGAYYGGAVAAPVVGKIIERGLIYVK